MPWPVICVSIIAGTIVLCVLRRIIQHFIPGFLYLPPTYFLPFWGPGGALSFTLKSTRRGLHAHLCGTSARPCDASQ